MNSDLADTLQHSAGGGVGWVGGYHEVKLSDLWHWWHPGFTLSLSHVTHRFKL